MWVFVININKPSPNPTLDRRDVHLKRCRGKTRRA
jgi:hypothetical protein